ncbi:unnamed protein product [Amaranthus hypochondriacus]
MVDQETVCCMCGDIGFADKLFQCSSCRFRFQHSYCSSYNYGSHDFSSSSSSSSSMMKSMEICDWCKSEGRNNSSSTNTTKSYKRSSSMDHNDHLNNSQGDQRMKRHQIQEHHLMTNNTVSGSSSGNHSNKNNSSGIPSPRPNAHRRYKLLKDVMC